MSKSILIPVLLLSLSLIWGSSFILIKIGLESFEPLQLGIIRIVFGAVFMLPIYLGSFRKLPSFHLKFFAVGMIGSVVPAILFSVAQTQMTSSLTGILNSLTPVLAFLVSVLFFGKRATRAQVVGLLIGLVGSALLGFVRADGEMGSLNWFVLFVLGATVCYGVNVNLLEAWFKGVKSLHLTAASLVYSAIPGLLILPFLGGGINWESDRFYVSLAAVVCLGAIGTGFALTLFNKLLQITSGVEASLVTYLIPVVAVIIGVATGERLFLWHFIGMSGILLGIYVINLERFRKSKS